MTNKCIVSVAQQYLWREENIPAKSKWMQILPLFIAYGVTCSLQIPLMAGITVVPRIVMSEAISDICRKIKPQFIMYSPAAYEQFADENLNIDMSNLIEASTGGDRLAPAVEKK